jgi:hypothetical protein
MNRLQKLKWTTMGGAIALVTLLAAAQTDTLKTQATKITGKTLIAVDELKWVPMPGLEGAQQAMLWGDPTKGSPPHLLQVGPGHEGADAPPHVRRPRRHHLRHAVARHRRRAGEEAAAGDRSSRSAAASSMSPRSRATRRASSTSSAKGAFDAVMAEEAGAKKK